MSHSRNVSLSQIDRRIILALLLLSLVPVVAGFVRMIGLAGGGEITPENARFFASPLPVVLHIIGAALFCVLGAFQFAPGVRAARPRTHRILGRILVPAGLVAALTGLWMTRFYPPAAEDGPILDVIRYLFGSAMALFLVLGMVAIARRDFASHHAWMVRAYAIGMGAGTQVLTNVPYLLLVGTPRGLVRDGLMLVGWVLNVTLAEWIISRELLYPARAQATATKTAGAVVG